MVVPLLSTNNSADDLGNIPEQPAIVRDRFCSLVETSMPSFQQRVDHHMGVVTE